MMIELRRSTDMSRITSLTCITFILSCILLCSCSGKESVAKSEHKVPPRDSAPKVLTPCADGTVVYNNDYASIDASNTSQGYIMVSYSGDCPKVKVQITGSDQIPYTYLLIDRGAYTTFPLSAGNGAYTIQVLENVEGDSYLIALSQDIDVAIEDEFLPFLYPNQYVSFTAGSKTVIKGSELAKNAYSDLEVIQNIYHYVIENISYDTAKANSVTYGYLPDIDDTLKSGTGICFDYASVMTAMLRSQGMPTKLEVGYSGEALHAWISTYTKDTGWIDDIIEFDGTSWELMDPTLAANNNTSSVGLTDGVEKTGYGFRVADLFGNEESPAERREVAPGTHPLARGLRNEKIAVVVQIGTFEKVPFEAARKKALLRLIRFGAVTLPDEPILLVYDGVRRQNLQRLDPAGVHCLVFGGRDRKELRERYPEGDRNVGLLAEDAPLLDGEDREFALQCCGFQYASHRKSGN